MGGAPEVEAPGHPAQAQRATRFGGGCSVHRPRRSLGVNPGAERTMNRKSLFIVTAVLEAGTGLALAIAPAIPVSLLLGASIDEPAALVIARVTGVALLALTLACWSARDD